MIFFCGYWAFLVDRFVMIDRRLESSGGNHWSIGQQWASGASGHDHVGSSEYRGRNVKTAEINMAEGKI
jgi:hypothetical protein